MADRTPDPVTSAMAADSAFARLKSRHDGKEGCATCYLIRGLCPWRELARQYERLLNEEGRKLDAAEELLRENTRLRSAIHYALEHGESDPPIEPHPRTVLRYAVSGESLPAASGG